MICYQCDAEVCYLFPDARCSECTRVEPDESMHDCAEIEEMHQGDAEIAKYEEDQNENKL